MTVIAYRDGIMAADSLMVVGGARVGTMIKIARVDNALAGAVGSAGYAMAFLRWFQNGENGDPPVAVRDMDICDRGLVVRNRIITIYEDRGSFIVEADFYAMGCGSAEARGAMAHGASAHDAVRAAIMIDVNCGEPIVVLKHRD